MKKTTLLLLFACTLFSASAQTEKQPQNSLHGYFMQYQQSTMPESFQPDAALENARIMASDKQFAALLSNSFHTALAQAFIVYPKQSEADSARIKSRQQRALQCHALLLRMAADTSPHLRTIVMPVFLWTEVQKNKDNAALLAAPTREFMAIQSATADSYTNKLDRYGLMIHEIIAKHIELKPLATKLFDAIKTNLKNNQITATDSSTRAELERRAYYRYLYAYVNYLEAGTISNDDAKEKLLKNAFDYSPDLLDLNHRYACFYDMIFVLSGSINETYQDEYVDFLMTSPRDKNQVLHLLRQMALGDPSFKAKLKEYYEAHHASKGSFDQYWEEAVHSSGKAAPPISLALLGKESFSTKNLTGKWVLVDFWGTWCLPCRQEHPDLQKFYESTVAPNPDKISLLTIACRDTPEKVSAYMQDKKYSFPVAMSDNIVQNTYAVQGYPTKVLITPKGNYIIVPFGGDWVKFVKEYSGL
jgi:thiol-disulfide isomerase/thioredoxin